MKTSDFYYDLPQELIAQTPIEKRDTSRLMTLDRVSGATGHHHFYDLPDYLNPGDVLVVNPASLGFCTPQQLRVQTGCEGLRCIALQMSVTDAATLNAYDDVLSVYDPVETLREKIMQPVGDAPREERQEPLSAREREIVVCIVKGMTNKQIADALCISTHTVITHRRNIVAKLQIHSPAGLTIYAIVNKLVDLSDIRDTIAEI